MATNLTNLTEVRGLSELLRNRERQAIENVGDDSRLSLKVGESERRSEFLRSDAQSRIASARETQFLTDSFTASSFSSRMRNYQLLHRSTSSLFGGTMRSGSLLRELSHENEQFNSAKELEEYFGKIASANEKLSSEFKNLDSLIVELQTLIDNLDLDDLKNAPFDSTVRKIDSLIMNLNEMLPELGTRDTIIREIQRQSGFSGTRTSETQQRLSSGSDQGSGISQSLEFIISSNVSTHETNLANSAISSDLITEFEKRGITLSSDAYNMQVTASSQWEISDGSTDRRFAVVKNRGMLEVHRVDQGSFDGESIRLGNDSIIDSLIIRLRGLSPDDPKVATRMTDENIEFREKLADRLELLSHVIVELRAYPLTKPDATDPLRKEPVLASLLNLETTKRDGYMLTGFSDSLNARLSILGQQVEKLNSIAPPAEAKGQLTHADPARLENINMSSRLHGDRPIGIRFNGERENVSSVEDFYKPRPTAHPLQLGTRRMSGSGLGGGTIIAHKSFSQSDFDRFAKSNTGLLTNNYI